MIQLGSKVRVVRPGRFEVRGEVVDMGPARFGGRSKVKVRPDPDQVTVVAYPGQLDRWVEVSECVEEEPVMPVPPDAPSPRLYGCGGCTHSRIPRDREASGGSADENEFECLLLGRAETRRRCKDAESWRDPELVWGENPICTDADWPVYQVSAPPDAPSPRPTRDDAESLRVLADWCPDGDDATALRVVSDQLEESGDDAGAALLRHVAGRIEYGLENLKKTAELLYFHNTVMRKRLDHIQRRSAYDDATIQAHRMAVSIGSSRDGQIRPPAGDIPDRDTPAAP